MSDSIRVRVVDNFTKGVSHETNNFDIQLDVSSGCSTEAIVYRIYYRYNFTPYRDLLLQGLLD